VRSAAILTLAATIGSILLPAADAGGAPVPLSRSSATLRPAVVPDARKRGASPYATCTEERARRATMRHTVPASGAATQPSYLYVADLCGPVIDVLQAGKTYREDGYISNGLVGPADVVVDPLGNLFVANLASGGGNVVEYAQGNLNAPSFMYNANITQPIAVTTDAGGNVYEGDYSGIVNEYYPNRNTAIASCQPVNNGDYVAIDGVAVDSYNDVFATVHDGTTSTSELIEYPGGLGSCGNLRVLLSANYELYGIAVDKNAKLLITYQTAVASGVAVVDPPYRTFSRRIGGTGFQYASNVRLNNSNRLVFVTDVSADTVTVLNYPSGTIVTVLGTAEGLSVPQAAVEQPNAVY
jgi:hypothetical protein